MAPMSSKRTRITVVAVVAVVAVALTAGLLHRDDETIAPLAMDGTAPLPRVVGKDLVSGEHIDVATMRGRPLVINVWAEWCLPCREEAPILKAFAAKHPEIRMLGIVGNSGRRRALDVNTELGWPWQSIYDPNGMIVLTTLEVQNYPATLFVDSAGVVRGRKLGAVTAAELDQAARALD